MLVDKTLLQDLEARGLVFDCSHHDEMVEHLSESRAVYAGFDPTADSLHIGHLVPLLMLRRFQQAGHTPIALVGGATGLIGDPSFKAAERKLNSDDIVADWTKKLQKQVSQFISFEGANAAKAVNNYDWVSRFNVISFLRDVGKHFSVNMMIKKDSVRARLEREDSGISYTEFSYMLLQSLDFAELYKAHNCTVQVGGSDQWGNITGGIDLTRRLHQGNVFGLTVPLITKSDGTKFGKTEGGAVWLDPAKTSPYSFYQFWLNVADVDVERFLKYFTFLSLDEIAAVSKAHAENAAAREGQRTLAREMTKLVHGDEALQSAERITEALFSDKLDTLSESELVQLQQDGMPSTVLPENNARPLVDLLVETGLAASKRVAREFLEGNAISVNGEKVSALDASLEQGKAFYGKFHILRRGKKQFHLVRWN